MAMHPTQQSTIVIGMAIPPTQQSNIVLGMAMAADTTIIRRHIGIGGKHDKPNGKHDHHVVEEEKFSPSRSCSKE